MLRIRQSNQLQRLAEDFIDYFQAQAQKHSPLDECRVIVQSTGMARWLSYQVAGHCGVSAGLKFYLPAVAIWQLIKTLTEAEEDAFDKQGMTWRLFRLLNDQSLSLWQQPASEGLKALLGRDKKNGDAQTFQLAGQLADIFDQYLIYRPDWMLDWRAGKTATGEAAKKSPWQPLLWQSLAEDCNRPDRAMLQKQTAERLQSAEAGEIVRRQFGSTLSLFGLSAMPPQQLRLLLMLEKHLDINLYVCNPCQEYWEDIVSQKYYAVLAAADANQTGETLEDKHYETGHPLLSATGWAGGDFIYRLLELSENGDDQANFRASDDTHLLGRLQKDILQLKSPEADNKTPVSPDDNSIQFAKCYGPLREVEVLQDWLLAQFAARSDLQLKDVVVMVPDIDQYAPYIETIFGGVERHDARYMPYSLCDHSQGDGSTLTALTYLMQLPDKRLTATEIYNLISTTAIRRKFNIKTLGYPRLSYLIQQAGIRWGQDDAHWQETGAQSQSHYPHTWSFGLQRLMASYTLGEGEGIFRQLPTVAGLHQEPDSGLTQLLRLLTLIQKYRKHLQGPHTVRRWVNTLRELVADFFDLEADGQAALSDWHHALAGLNRLEKEADLVVTREVIVKAMAPDRYRSRSSYRFLDGRLTFCTLVPMRNIPFRVVALLGMNEKDFPRSSGANSLNLLEDFKRRGDRDKRGEELYMFLEALLAAQDRLYISWSDYNTESNQIAPPSVVVTLLQSTLDQHFDRDAQNKPVSEQLTLQHPLQPFSKMYKGKAPLITYSSLWKKTQLPEETARQSQLDPVLSLAPNDLVNFFKAPARCYLRQRYDIYPPEELDRLTNHEPFALHGLEAYQLKETALKALSSTGNLDAWHSARRLDGSLPFSLPGQIISDDMEALMQTYKRTIGEKDLGSPVEALAIDLSIGQYRLTGQVPDCLAEKRLVLRPNRAKSKDHIALWLYHLILSADGQAKQSLLIDDESAERGRPLSLEAVERSAAQFLLTMYLDTMNQYLQSPIPLAVDSSATLAREYEGGNEAGAISKAREKWFDSSPYSEGADWCNRKLWKDFPGDLAPEAFQTLALKIWLPWYEQIKEAGQDK